MKPEPEILAAVAIDHLLSAAEPVDIPTDLPKPFSSQKAHWLHKKNLPFYITLFL
jgi:hypothetical protein